MSQILSNNYVLKYSLTCSQIFSNTFSNIAKHVLKYCLTHSQTLSNTFSNIVSSSQILSNMFSYYKDFSHRTLYTGSITIIPLTSTRSSPGKPRASMLNFAGSATMALFNPGPSADGDVSSSISCKNGEPLKKHFIILIKMLTFSMQLVRKYSIDISPISLTQYCILYTCRIN